MKQESPNFSRKLSRRELLKLGGVGLGTVLLGSCSPPPEPRPTALPRPTARPAPEVTSILVPTRVPTRTRTPEPTPTRTPEPTATPEPPKLLERVKVDILGFSVEKFAVKFQDITDQISSSYKIKIEEWLNRPELSSKTPDEIQPIRAGGLDWWWRYPLQSGFSVATLAYKIRPNHDVDVLYYHQGRFFPDLPTPPPLKDFYSNSFWKMRGDDLSMLNWQTGFVIDAFGISRRGQLLYRVSNDTNYDRRTKDALIIADVPNGTKTVIREEQMQYIPSMLSSDGNRLFLYPHDVYYKRDYKRGPYLVDLNDWGVKFHLDETPDFYYENFLNEDGSRLYLLPGKDGGISVAGYMYDTLTGERSPITWPTHLTSYTHTSHASPDLRFISRMLGMFSSTYTQEGQWGILIYTPSGFFQISSPRWSMVPWKISNLGTIYTSRGDVFEFERGHGGTYKAIKTGDGKPNEVEVTKVK